MGRKRVQPTDLPLRLQHKSGGYYYVTCETGRNIWTHLGHSKETASARANELNALKRAERIAAIGKFRSAWAELEQQIFGERQNRCTYCGATEDLGLDHLIPFGSGGATAAFNLVISCLTCNMRKRDKDPTVFLLEVMGFKEALMNKFFA